MKAKVTDIRLSVIAGEDKHVSVHVSEAQAVKKHVGGGLFSDLVQFAETILQAHGDAEKVEIGWDETKQTVTISPASSASSVIAAFTASSTEYGRRQGKQASADKKDKVTDLQTEQAEQAEQAEQDEQDEPDEPAV
jgi:hypothetical protein